MLLRRGTTEYRYDARGRRTAKITLDKDGKKQTTLYEWDGRDRLRRILRPDGVQLNYSYDAFGRRVHKLRRAVDGEIRNNNFIWDGEVLAAELDDQRGPRAFVHEPGGFEPILQQQNGEVFVSVNDHLGMPKDLVSGDGLVVWSAAHSAYGKIVAVDADLAAKQRYGTAESGTAGARGTATPVGSPFRLLGQVADEDAELGWTRFRCFDAESGRWLSPDPVGISGSFNLSAFDGSPSAASDPLGLNTDGGNGHVITEGTVFRGGSNSDANLTPRPDKDTVGEKRGLSTFDTPEKAADPGQKVQQIDVAKLGPDLEAYKTPDGHVSIRPKDDTKLGDWAAQRGSPNDLTDQVRQGRVGERKV